MENDGEILQLIGILKDWECLEHSAIDITTMNDKGRVLLLPKRNKTYITLRPRIEVAVTTFDKTTLKRMMRQLLCFRISVATEEDIVVQKAKERLSEKT